MTIKSEVGDTVFIDTFEAISLSNWYYGDHKWDPTTRLSHTVTIRGQASSTGQLYIPIRISFDMVTHGNEHLYYSVKGIQFKTVADVAAAANSPPASTPAGTIAGAIIGALAIVALLLLGFFLYRKRKQRNQTPGPPPVNVAEQPQYTVPTPGGNAQWGPMTMQDQSRPVTTYDQPRPGTTYEQPRPGTTYDQSSPMTTYSQLRPGTTYEEWRPETTHGQPPMSPIPPSTTGSSFSPPTTIASLPSKATPQRIYSSGKDNPASFFPSRSTNSERGRASPIASSSGAGPSQTHDSPPVYGNSRVLSTWASANRAAVSEDMESKLLSAGYMPGDDPDLFTEDEWQTKFGLTRLELVRLRRLYSGTHKA